MAGNKTLPNDADVGEFLNSVEPERRRHDALQLLELMNAATGLKPRMWGSAIVGYGRYGYRYESGRTGEMCLTGFSPRKSALTVYVMPGFKPYADQLARLGKHKHSVSCLYLGSLASIDCAVLTEIVADSVERMKSKYPDWSER
ncbi:MAG: DUF1801 domain-containing protein [Rhizobiaceae bacterium]|nr:DUF1801 domain-containing protein [Rhizobiaceae bacterium]